MADIAEDLATVRDSDEWGVHTCQEFWDAANRLADEVERLRKGLDRVRALCDQRTGPTSQTPIWPDQLRAAIEETP